ncbi:MAG: Ig-like domain-containing protein, partial [Planctomycetota bacterium]
MRATLLLRRRPAVAIQLVDAGGEPLPRAGVEVSVAHYRTQPNGTEAGRLLDVVTTDAQGRADVSVLIPVVAEAGAGFTDTLGFQPMGAGIYRPPGTGSRFDARLLTAAQVRALGGRSQAEAPAVITVPVTPSRPVTLRVVDSLGRPLSGVEVTATPRTRFREGTVRTDTDGLATLDYLGEPHGDDLTDEAGNPSVNTLGVKIGEDHWDAAVASVVHGDLAGRLEIADALEHRPLTAAERQHYAAELDEEAAEARAEAAGHARALAKAEQEIQRAQRDLEAQSDSVARLTLTGTRLLTLECVDGAGTAWRDLTVRIDTDAEAAAGDPAEGRTLDAGGRLTVRVPLEATVLWMRAEDAERNALFPAAIALEPDRTRYRIVLHRQERLEIVVRWPAGADGGRLMSQLTFHIRDAATDDPIGSTRPSGGTAEIPGLIWLPSRRVILEAQTPDSSYRGRIEVDVPAGGRVVLDMQRGAAAVDVRVVVVDPIGKPAAGLVRAHARSGDAEPYAFEGDLDAAGGFTFPLVPGGYTSLVVEV